MKSKKLLTLHSQSTAVLGLPTYLLIMVIVIATIMGLCILSLQQLLGNSDIHQVETEINRITTEAANMFEYADEGTSVNLHVKFPASLRFIVFGGYPTNSTTEPLKLSLDEKTSNNYYYVMTDGVMRSYHSNARFSNHNITQIVVLHPGTYDVTLELCFHEGKSYVTIVQ